MFHSFVVATLLYFTFICPRQASSNDTLEFRFSSSGTIPEWYCVLVHMINPPGWHDNYVCTNKPLPMTFRSSGGDCNRASGNKCVHLVEPSDPAWTNNQLCLTDNVSLELVWSWCGVVKGMKCVLLYEPGSNWIYDDNYLCWKEY